MTNHHSFVTVHGERGDELERALGTRVFPVQSILPARVLTAIGAREVYFLALEALLPEVRESIVTHLGEKFGLSKEEREEELVASGVPILANDCTVTTTRLFFL